MGVCRFIFDYMCVVVKLTCISIHFKCKVFENVSNCICIHGWCTIFSVSKFRIFLKTCFRSIQVILQLICSALTSDVCCLKIPLLLGEKDMVYVCNKVSFFFIFGGGGGGGGPRL